MRETVELRRDEEEYLMEQVEEGTIYAEESGYMWFEDDKALLDWCDKSKKIGDFEYEFGGKNWLINVDTFEAYTEEGLKTYYKTGEIGHVRRQLRETGTYMVHAKESKFIYEEDEDDVRGVLPIKYDDDYEEELETLRAGRS